MLTYFFFCFIEGCEYGDKSTDCYFIERRDCYNSTVHRQCCDTCEEERNDNLAGNLEVYTEQRKHHI